MKKLLLLALLVPASLTQAQTNVRAWYAEGQVWVVWEAAAPYPEWCAVYAKPTVFSSTNDATFLGRPHLFEYGSFQLKEQIDTSFTARIPSPTGVGKYVLAQNEGLFVFTPHQAGALFFAVVANNETAVNAGQNITATAVPFQYDPLGDPVECHLQSIFPSPFANGFTCLAYMMWADGRQNQWEGRSDFPIMANAAKNGMPSLFLISAPEGLDTTQPFPLSVWLHGGGGTARQSLAGSRAEVNIKPVEGVLLSHDDNLIGWREQSQPWIDMPSWHFGWRKNYDPFNPGNAPAGVDTIVNYTQRRYLWIDEWLFRHFNIDRHRVHIHGHSMGSAGATALAKCYPEHYASVTIFNNGFGGPEPGSNVAIFGEPVLNFPTSLKNRAGETVRLLHLFNLLDNCAPARDWPVIRHWHGKNDDNGTMRWDSYVVENYRKADSLGYGVQNMWSERNHGMDTGPAHNDHWISGIPANEQTAVDNVAFAENRFRSDQSFPAFFNHRLDPDAHDPGSGLIGINNGDGDNWGAWGGYHRWEVLKESEVEWSAAAWLESNAVFANDNCPYDSLTADVMIRRPQKLGAVPGFPFYFYIQDGNTGSYLQTGGGIANDEGLVTLENVVVYREDIRKVYIHVLGNTPTKEAAGLTKAAVFPNPSKGFAELSFEQNGGEALFLRISDANGAVLLQNIETINGTNRIQLDLNGWNPGVYFLSLAGPSGVQALKLILTR